MTLHTSSALRVAARSSPPPSSPASVDANARQLVDVVKTPTPALLPSFRAEKPWRMMRQTAHLSEAQRLLEEATALPRAQESVAPWKRSSSLPSARQRGCFLGS